MELFSIATGILGDLMRIIKGFKPPFEFRWEIWISLKALHGKGPHFALRGESRGVSRFEAGSFLFFIVSRVCPEIL